ncbi:Potassium transporter [Dillenia turbinata]|uniref:Potassium transporter n=1 Tax=Dillenia turbinata TaxID=194707 RepID=A0AAN8UMC5_9MAGN
MEEDTVVEVEEVVEQQRDQNQHGDASFGKHVEVNPFDFESGDTIIHTHKSREVTLLKLAFQSIGVVYGDIGTSPLFMLAGVFPNGIQHSDDILGVLSLIIYSLIVIFLIKYVFIVLSANDNGDGGTFALYSLICRHAKVSLIPDPRTEDKEVSTYQLDASNHRLGLAFNLKSFLENSQHAKKILFLITILGTSMVIGDGVLTPCTSVVSAVAGLKESKSSLSDNVIMWLSALIIILLFQIQRFGTDKVGYSFSPVLTVWFLFITIIGIYNFIVYDPTVIKALNPWYIVQYFKRNRKDAWISLGGVFLCLTGAEALFADLGHFNVRSIQISSCSLVFPSMIIAYIGQGSYLRKYPVNVPNTFYASVPKPAYWPMFVVAVFSSMVSSQSMISGTFSIVQQAMALGCFPRVKVVHTSPQYDGQIYVPEINTLLMLACVGVTLTFKNSLSLSNAYGLAVIFVFILTSAFLVLVMIMIWKTNILLVLLYILTVGALELLFLSSLLVKFSGGGYLSLAFAGVFVIIMYVWNYGYRMSYIFELENKVSAQKVKEIALDPKIGRLPGLALFYTELVHGISPIFTHYISNVPALHSILIFVTIKTLPISKVPPDERFLFGRIEPYDLFIFRCVVRYGYNDARKERGSFQKMLVDRLKEFIKEDIQRVGSPNSRRLTVEEDNFISNGVVCNDEDEGKRDVEFLNQQLQEGGVIYLFAENQVICSKGSSLWKRLVIEYGYHWLTRFIRQPDEIFLFSHLRLLKVGMIYEV